MVSALPSTNAVSADTTYSRWCLFTFIYESVHLPNKTDCIYKQLPLQTAFQPGMVDFKRLPCDVAQTFIEPMIYSREANTCHMSMLVILQSRPKLVGTLASCKSNRPLINLPLSISSFNVGLNSEAGASMVWLNFESVSWGNSTMNLLKWTNTFGPDCRSMAEFLTHLNSTHMLQPDCNSHLLKLQITHSHWRITGVTNS